MKPKMSEKLGDTKVLYIFETFRRYKQISINPLI